MVLSRTLSEARAQHNTRRYSAPTLGVAGAGPASGLHDILEPDDYYRVRNAQMSALMNKCRRFGTPKEEDLALMALADHLHMHRRAKAAGPTLDGRTHRALPWVTTDTRGD